MRRTAHAFVHVRLSSVRTTLTDADLVLLTMLSPTPALASAGTPGIPATTPLPPAAAAGSAAPPPLRITTLVQAQLQVTLCPARLPPSAAADPSAPSPGPCFELTSEEVSLLHASGLSAGGLGLAPGGSLLSASAAGVQCFRIGSSSATLAQRHQQQQGGEADAHHPPRLAAAGAPPQQQRGWWQAPEDEDVCVLCCPLRPHSTAAQPCLNLVLLQPPPQPLPPTDHHQPPPTAVASVLARGVTIATDHGSLTLDWAQQLAALLSGQRLKTTAAPQDAGANSPTAAAPPSAQPRLVVSLQDIALRHEPLPYPSPAVVHEYVSARYPTAAANAQPPPPTTTNHQPRSRSSASLATLSGSGSGAFDSTSAAAPTSTAHQPSALPSSASTSFTAASAAPSPVAMVLVVEHVRYEAGGDTDAGAAPTTQHPPPPPLVPSQPQQQQQPQQPQQQQQHLVLVNSIGLHLALAKDRGEGWGPSHACDVAGSKLQAAGYHCVLSETALRVAIRTSPPVAAAGGAGEAAAAAGARESAYASCAALAARLTGKSSGPGVSFFGRV